MDLQSFNTVLDTIEGQIHSALPEGVVYVILLGTSLDGETAPVTAYSANISPQSLVYWLRREAAYHERFIQETKGTPAGEASGG